MFLPLACSVKNTVTLRSKQRLKLFVCCLSGQVGKIVVHCINNSATEAGDYYWQERENILFELYNKFKFHAGHTKLRRQDQQNKHFESSVHSSSQLFWRHQMDYSI